MKDVIYPFVSMNKEIEKAAEQGSIPSAAFIALDFFCPSLIEGVIASFLVNSHLYEPDF